MDLRILSGGQALEVLDEEGMLRCRIPSRIIDSYAWDSLHRELLQNGEQWVIVPVDAGWVFIYMQEGCSLGVYGEGISVDVLAELFPERHGPTG